MVWIWMSFVRSIKPFCVQSLLHMMFLKISWTSVGLSQGHSILSVATGFVADKQVDCDEACSIGLEAASRIYGQLTKDVKLSRKDKVLTIFGSAHTSSPGTGSCSKRSSLVHAHHMCHERFEWHGRIPHIWACTTNQISLSEGIHEKDQQNCSSHASQITYDHQLWNSTKLDICAWWRPSSPYCAVASGCHLSTSL